MDKTFFGRRHDLSHMGILCIMSSGFFLHVRIFSTAVQPFLVNQMYMSLSRADVEFQQESTMEGLNITVSLSPHEIVRVFPSEASFLYLFIKFSTSSHFLNPNHVAYVKFMRTWSLIYICIYL